MGGRNPSGFLHGSRPRSSSICCGGEALDLLSRELGVPAARLTTWREACLDAGQEALKNSRLIAATGNSPVSAQN
jgi:hypothetical protein